MSKEKLKRRAKSLQKDKCAVSGKILPEPVSLYDAERKTPKAKGGKLAIGNVKAVLPQDRMKVQGTYVMRDDDMNRLKQTIDNRSQLIRLRNKINNQLLAFQRGTDTLAEDTIKFLQSEMKNIEKEENRWTSELKSVIKDMSEHDQIVKSALGVKSIGPVTVAYCLVYIDLAKAIHVSNIWSYAGLHVPSYERYKKGKAGGGNKTLRTILYTMADSQVKGHGPYRVIYDQVKERLSLSEKITHTRNIKGQLIEAPWKDASKGHRHGAALRAIMKHFLADYWFVGRTLMGLPTLPLYAESILGNGHKTILPEERGWVF